MYIEIAGIPVEVIKKNIKNMHLSVLPPDGKVRISAPSNLDNESIKMFIRTKIGWIRKQQEAFYIQPRQNEREYVSGETIYLWGKQYFLEVRYNIKSYTIDLEGSRAIFTVRKNSTVEHRKRFVREWYRKLLKKEIEKYLPKWEEITGFKSDGWQVKYMKTCWGTCNEQTKNLIFNLQLAKKSIECLEYIIIHELIHLKVKNHDSEFIRILDEYMPYWRDNKKLLNDSKLDYMAPKTDEKS
jgi:predicted metal-dependent hydrolase